MLAVCSVFRGGVDLARLEVVCAAAMELRVPVLSVLAELVDHSLLRRAGPGSAMARFAMLETVREFAAERLLELPERDRVRAGHAGVFWELVRELPRPPACPDRAGLDLLELEHDNLRAALDWYAESDPASGAADGESAHRVLVGARILLGGQAAAVRTARARPDRRCRAGGRPRRGGVAGDRPG